MILESFDDRPQDELAEMAFKDPVFFAHYFKYDAFKGRMPWVHRGLFSIQTQQVDFLWRYGEVHKLMREFVEKDENDKIRRRIFHVLDKTGREYNWEEIRDLEMEALKFEPPSQDLPTPVFNMDFVEKFNLELQLDIGKYTAIIMPRGFSKTTIAGQTIPLYKLLYQLLNFMVYISESSTHAEMQSNNIRTDLRGNLRIRNIFGNMCPERSSDEKWSERFFETTTGFALAAKGRGAQIRGLLHGSIRPQLELWDDLEDKESVATEEQRQKTRSWAYGDAMPALPELDDTATIVAVGTLLSADCLLMTLSKDPQWTTVIHGIQDSEGEYLWPELFDEKKDQVKKESYDLAGEIHTYYLEYYSKVYNEKIQVFQRNFFIYKQPDPGDIAGTALYCDPAIGEKETADRAVIQVVSIDKLGSFYLRDEWSERSKPDMVSLIAENYFRLAKLYTPDRYGFESVAFQKALATVFKYWMFKERFWFEVIPITVSTQKNKRILSIVAPKHRAGVLYFCKRFPETEREMINWDRKKKEQPDDGPDCLAGGIQLLEDYYSTVCDADLEDYEQYEENIPDLSTELGLRPGQEWRLH